MNNFEKDVKERYDSWGNLRNIEESMKEVQETLDEENFSRKNSRLVFSVCPDDINRVEDRKTVENALKGEYNGEFHLGGLGAYPIGGVSGITAASHHPPDDANGGERKEGNLIFFISPHFGVIEQKNFTYGKVIRPGQEKITSSCGAMMGFLAQLTEAGSAESFSIAADDNEVDPTRMVLQQQLIANHSDELDKILTLEDQNDQVVDLFKLNYDLVWGKGTEMIDEFLEMNHFEGGIAAIGGITVNLPEEDVFITKEITTIK